MTALIHIGSDALVHAPGHLYTPLALDLREARPPGDVVTPGELNPNEKRFVADLVRFLAPEELSSSSVEDPLPRPIVRDGVEYVLVRNIDQFPNAFRIRMPGDIRWFYPDFLLWITDRTESPTTQTLCLIDPKGIRQGLRGGWGDSKLLSLLYRLRLIEQQCAPDGLVRLPSGESVRFRARGVLLSNSPLSALREETPFALAAGRPKPCRATFRQAGIFFMDDDDYIRQMHDYLCAKDDWLLAMMRDLAIGTDSKLGRWFASVTDGTNLNAWLHDLLCAALPADGDKYTPEAALTRTEHLLAGHPSESR